MNFPHAIQAAQFYIAQGFRVIPINGTRGSDCQCGSLTCNAGKHEFAELDGQWKNGRVFTPSDFTLQMNIAVALGPWVGGHWICCLDVDGGAKIEKFLPGLPDTLTQKSPRGIHYFFTVPAFTPLGNWVRALGSVHNPGIDVWYARGKVNVAPSRSAAGAYEWREWRFPAELPASAISTILSERARRGLPIQSRWERKGKQP